MKNNKQITLKEIKKAIRMEKCNNNEFANYLSILLTEKAEYEKLKAKKYKEEGNERMAEVYTNCAKYHRRDANDLFEILDALGEYDNL